MDVDETIYEKNCFRTMLMERSQQPQYAPYSIKSDEIPHQYEDSSADLKMEHDMYYNDTYQGYYAPYQH